MRRVEAEYEQMRAQHGQFARDEYLLAVGPEVGAVLHALIVARRRCAKRRSDTHHHGAGRLQAGMGC